MQRTAWARKRTSVASLGCRMFVTLAFLTFGRGALGQAAPPLRIAYDAPSTCPNEASFEGQVRARTSKSGSAPEPGISVRVRITPLGGVARVDGEVTLEDAAGREARRHVEGGCADVVAALALITALALDPTASIAPVAALAPSSAGTAAAPALGAPPTPAASGSASTPPTPPPPIPKDVPAAKPAEPKDTDEAERAPGSSRVNDHSWAWSVGAQAGLTSGVTPEPLFTVPVFLDVARRSTSVLAPAFRLRFERADSGTVAASGGGADFTWTAGSADLCPITWSPIGRLRFWPCARIEAGVLQATGSNVTPTRSDTRPWLTAGGALRGRLTIYGALFTEVEGTVFAPIIRDRFFVEPDTTVQRAPAVAAGGGVGLGASFW